MLFMGYMAVPKTTFLLLEAIPLGLLTAVPLCCFLAAMKNLTPHLLTVGGLLM